MDPRNSTDVINTIAGDLPQYRKGALDETESDPNHFWDKLHDLSKPQLLYL